MYSIKQKEIYRVLQCDMEIKDISCDSMIDDIIILFGNDINQISITFKECYRFKIWKDIQKDKYIYKDITISGLEKDSMELYSSELQGDNINSTIWCKDILIN